MMVRRQFPFCLSAILATLAITAATQADTIHLRSAPSLRFIKVVAFKDARIEAISSTDGQRKTIDYGDIALIRVDGQPDLNEAERLLFAKQFDRAIQAFQKTLDKTPSRESWVCVWSETRLMNLLAGQKKVDRATEIYIRLARQIPDWVILVAPDKKDLKGTEAELSAAAEKILQARDDCKIPKVRDALGKFYQRFGRERPLPALKSIQAAEMKENDLDRYDQPGPWLDSWADDKIKAGKPDAVLRITERLAKSALRRNLPAVFYWQGRALLAKRDCDNAALKFLEIIVEFPSNAYAPQALFHAARAAKEAGRSNYARTLWQELIDNFANTNDYAVIQLVEQARDALREKE